MMQMVDDVSAISERLACLRDRRAELSVALRAIAREVEGGNISRASQVGAIRGELLDIERRIPSMEKELGAQRAEAHQRAQAAQRERFRNVLAEIEAQRQAVVEHTRCASLALGALPALQREAVDLANALGTAPVAEGAVGVWPADRAAITEAMRPIDPYSDWVGVQFLPVDVDGGTIRVKPVKTYKEI